MSSPASTNAFPFAPPFAADNADDENYHYTINPEAMVHTIITSIAASLHELRAHHAPTLLPPPPAGPNPHGPIGAPPIINPPYRPLPPSAFATPSSFFTLSAAVHNDDEEIRTAPAFRNARRLPPAPFCVASSSRKKKEDGGKGEGKGYGFDGTADVGPRDGYYAGPVAVPVAAPLAPAVVLLPTAVAPAVGPALLPAPFAAVIPAPIAPAPIDPATADLRARQILAYEQHTGQEPWLVSYQRDQARRERGRDIKRLKGRINGWRGRWGPVQTGMQQRLEELLLVQRRDG
ncbi:MAG: hypothetical protein L6R36_002383 [Xanthoria steineri]|nr:MAG: hypothetical protein L6R36_002383 [Xanthoria steineri]